MEIDKKRLFVFLLLVLFILSDCAIWRSKEELRITSPTERAELKYPRKTTVTWTTISKADNYAVIVEYSGEPYDYTSQNYYPLTKSNEGKVFTTKTTHTFHGIGGQVHRIKVMAYRKGKVIAETNWRYIDFLS
jgi:hypothetical protein